MLELTKIDALSLSYVWMENGPSVDGEYSRTLVLSPVWFSGEFRSRL